MLGLAAVAAMVVAALSVGSDSQATTSERIVTVSQGVVQQVVSGSGNLEPANQLDVNFGTTGRITKIDVEEGDHVSEGDLLAKLDSASQRVALAQAQAQLVDARDALTKAQAAASTTTATAASAATATAASVDGGTTIAVAAQATPTATTTPVATPTPTPTPTTTPSATPSPRATATPRASATPAAGASPNGRSGGSGASGSSGGSNSSGGGNSTGGSTQSVESASAAVQSAELAVSQAQDALDATTLRAPAAGTVASIANQVGDTVGSQSGSSSAAASSFIVLAQLSRLKLQVALSESDIGKVKEGQKATVTINAASGEEVAAHVSSIGVLSSSDSSSSQQGTGTGTGSSGAVSYPVVVSLDQTTDGVRAGMSATADIVTSQASGVMVPNQALRGSTVTLVSNGERTTQRVETGVVGDSTTQVVSGLQAGDRVVITSTSALAGGAASGADVQQLRQRFGGGAGGLGGGALGGIQGGPAGGGGGTFRRGG